MKAPYRDLFASLSIAHEPVIASWSDHLSTFIETDEPKSLRAVPRLRGGDAAQIPQIVRRGDIALDQNSPW